MRITLPITKDINLILSKDEHGYADVLDAMDEAEWVDVVTYNLGTESGILLERLRGLRIENIRVVTNVPNRFSNYYGAGKQRFKNNLTKYKNLLNADIFQSTADTFFNPSNHAKIILTDSIGYIGSSNFSEASAENFECGVLITCPETIKKVRSEFVDKIVEYSHSTDISALKEATIFIVDIRKNLARLIVSLGDELTGSSGQHPTPDALQEIIELIDAIEGGLHCLNEYSDHEKSSEILDQVVEVIDIQSLRNLRDLLEHYDSRLLKLAEFSAEDFMNSYLNEPDIAREAYDEHVDKFVQFATNAAQEKEEELFDAAQKELQLVAKFANQFVRSSDSALGKITELESSIWKFDNT